MTAGAPGAAPSDARPLSHDNLLWARALVEGLVAGGTRFVVLSPGSRSSPIAFALARDKRIRVHVQVDERSASFVALGFAKASRSPVAIVCTSGTAAANWLPAMAEARLSGVPLVAVTADRPPELRGTGASQTIDQIGLYGRHALSFTDLPCPGDAGLDLREACAAGRRACDEAMSGAGGPVHLNVPFREPLLPSPAEMSVVDQAWSAVEASVRGAARGEGPVAVPAATDAEVARVASLLAHARRAVIVAGPEAVDAKGAASVLALAKSAGVPVFADIASNLRQGDDGGAVRASHADLFLRDEAFAALAPDFVLRLGNIPTSKVLATWLARHRPPMVAVQPDARRRDPDGVVGEVVVADAALFCAAVGKKGDASLGEGSVPHPADKRDSSLVEGTFPHLRAAWLSLVADAEAGARERAKCAPKEARAVVAACEAVPAGGAIFLSSSMPVRWAEFYATALAPGVEVFVNRGANGIDGILSTAAGVAMARGKPTLCVIGDLAFAHDAGGLRSVREAGDLKVLLLDNDGGGIFSHLPVARHEDIFEPYFGTPSGMDFAKLTEAAGVVFQDGDASLASKGSVPSLVSEPLVHRELSPLVLRVRTDRKETVGEQQACTRLAGVHDERVDAAGLQWKVRSRGLSRGTPLVMLHGFTGTGEFWTPVANRLPAWRCVFPDLPGHGGTGAPIPPEEWRLDRAADSLLALLDAMGIDDFALAGYSMGGRLALSVALKSPARVKALALVGATPGIADAKEREARQGSDTELARRIETGGIAAFSAAWEANPLFATQANLDDATRRAMREQRLAQDASALAASLRAFGTGFQPPLHDELPRLEMPVLAMAGALDAKFSAIAREMAGRIPGARACLVEGAGHAVPLERPDAFAHEIHDFLTRSLSP